MGIVKAIMKKNPEMINDALLTYRAANNEYICNTESIFSFQDSLFTRRIRDFEVNLTRNKINNT